jgi:hypothetical protein
MVEGVTVPADKLGENLTPTGHSLKRYRLGAIDPVDKVVLDVDVPVGAIVVLTKGLLTLGLVELSMAKYPSIARPAARVTNCPRLKYSDWLRRGWMSDSAYWLMCAPIPTAPKRSDTPRAIQENTNHLTDRPR